MYSTSDSIDKPYLWTEKRPAVPTQPGCIQEFPDPFATPIRREERVSDIKVDGKKMKRVLANSRSARQSYLRRKEHFAQLTTPAAVLSKKNSDLVEENKQLRLQLMVLQKQLGVSSGLPNNHEASARSHQGNDYPLSWIYMF